METCFTPKFPLGRIFASTAALLSIAPEEMAIALRRHANGDWGELSAEDVAENDYSLQNGLRLLSAYTTAAKVRLWIITEADRSVTTVLLPEDY